MQTRTWILALTLFMGICLKTTAEPLRAQCKVICCNRQGDQLEDIGLFGNYAVFERSLPIFGFWCLYFFLSQGISFSESWAMLADNGMNYCTFYNLIEGSGLVDVEGYKEYTNEWICLAYSTANCTIY
nr:uncharacterized protein wu:fc46h12 [Misgurnus anguillicaudatus]